MTSLDYIQLITPLYLVYWAFITFIGVILRSREGCEVLWWVCLFVCLSVRLLAYLRNHTAKLHQDKVSVCARCLWPWFGPFWRHLDVLCTSGFVDDVMFQHGGLCGASLAFAETAAWISTKFCWTIKISKCTSRVACRGNVCHIRLPYFLSIAYTSDLTCSDRI